MKLSFKADNLQDNGVVAVAGVAGGMTSGAVNAITPAKYKTAGKIGHVILGLVIASSASGKDTSAKAVQGFGAGLAIKAGYDLATENLRKVVPVDATKDSIVSNLTQGALGMKGGMAQSVPTHLLGEWSGNMNDNFEYGARPQKTYKISQF